MRLSCEVLLTTVIKLFLKIEILLTKWWVFVFFSLISWPLVAIRCG